MDCLVFQNFGYFGQAIMATETLITNVTTLLEMPAKSELPIRGLFYSQKTEIWILHAFFVFISAWLNF